MIFWQVTEGALVLKKVRRTERQWGGGCGLESGDQRYPLVCFESNCYPFNVQARLGVSWRSYALEIRGVVRPKAI